VRNKVKDCQDHGLRSVLEKYDASLSEADLLARIAALNADPASTASWCRCRCPSTSTRRRSSRPSRRAKDVDGFSVQSAGALMSGLPGLRPARPTAA
jgi:methylenetetrahydrofolate dehydrogenase (NADP+)/methenyltetrahydrofolate cyclohydrolase